MLKRLIAVVALVLSAVVVSAAPASAQCPGEYTIPSGSWSILHNAGIC